MTSINATLYQKEDSSCESEVASSHITRMSITRVMDEGRVVTNRPIRTPIASAMGENVDAASLISPRRTYLYTIPRDPPQKGG